MKLFNINQNINMPLYWQDMIWGECFQESLNKHLNPYLEKICGLYMIKIGNLSAEINTINCPITNQININNIFIKNNCNCLQVIAQPMFLPFQSKSIDVCLCIHTFTWNNDTHGILSEIDRVLIDNGWIIISGFNPFSILGLSKFIPYLRNKVPCNGKMFSKIVILDWLNILNYEIISHKCFQAFPWKSKRVKIINNYFPIIGCINVTIARKKSFSLIFKEKYKILNKKHFHQALNLTNR